MKNLKNWDKKNWLSSANYISSLIHFFEKKVKFNKKTKILDIGCGSGKIMSNLSRKHRMQNLPLGLDVVRHNNSSKKIRFIKIDALKYLSSAREKFDVIFFKQSIHFFKLTEIKKILRLSKKILHPKGKIIILALHAKKNHWPVFKTFKLKLLKSFKKDQIILKLVKFSFKEYKIDYFVYKVNMTRVSYLQMIKNRFTSCLLNFSSKELKIGKKEIEKKYAKKLLFYDRLICITYKKK